MFRMTTLAFLSDSFLSSYARHDTVVSRIPNFNEL